jgi:hypothetical protein
LAGFADYAEFTGDLTRFWMTEKGPAAVLKQEKFLMQSSQSKAVRRASARNFWQTA